MYGYAYGGNAIGVGQVPSVYTHNVGAPVAYGESHDVANAIQIAGRRWRGGIARQNAAQWTQGGLDAEIARVQGYVALLVAHAQRARSLGHNLHAARLDEMAAIANAEVKRLGGMSQMNGDDYGAEAVGATNVVTGVTGALLGAALAAVVTVVTKRKITTKMILGGAAVGGAAGAFAPQYLPANAVNMVRKVIPSL